MVKQNKMVSYDFDKARPLLSVFEQALLITGYILIKSMMHLVGPWLLIGIEVLIKPFCTVAVLQRH